MAVSKYHWLIKKKEEGEMQLFSDAKKRDGKRNFTKKKEETFQNRTVFEVPQERDKKKKQKRKRSQGAWKRAKGVLM